MKQHTRVSPGLILLIVLALFLLNLSALAWLGWPVLQERGIAFPTAGLSIASASETTAQPTETATATHTPTPTLFEPTRTSPAIYTGGSDVSQQGVLILAMRDGEFSHLFAYHPGLLPLTRVTNSDWDDIDPAISPDGTKLAFSSRQNGYWDLAILDLSSGSIERVTDTPEYEGHPSWSPDGQWLVYSANYHDDLDIYLISLSDLSQEPIRLTENPGVDTAPAWSPSGRKIAFVSTRTGNPQIWMADLDRTDEQRFTQVSRDLLSANNFPSWSPDGRTLAWSNVLDGEHRILVWNSQQPDTPPAATGFGDRPEWSPDGKLLITSVEAPNQTGMEIYEYGTAKERMPFLPLNGAVYGLTWAPGPLGMWIGERIQASDTLPAPALVEPVMTLAPNAPNQRTGLVTIDDISAPVPMLSDAVDEAFQALRLRAAQDSGWDILSSLENAYLPLTTPNDPSIQEEWLYTGRAFAINPLILSAGWMAITREDYNGFTYWRLFLKARYQDGSAGLPLDRPTWDLNARFSGDTSAYEKGGKAGPVPSGYWIDLTELAQRYLWERLPSRPNWRTFFPAIRFNQFVYRDGLDWNAAMAAVYPVEALATPTSIPTQTATFTPTQGPTRYRTTITLTPTLTPTATRRPTFTKQQ